ncbi:MAG: hypothetical protein JST44_08465 [Cyanobacteria bacterium SZAS LIN-5]|nr:hypothetical protein [Cyanobacteria bacterium SZAS LIN-5]
MNRAVRFFPLLFAFILLLSLPGGLTAAQDSEDVDDFSDDTMNKRFDWVIMADTTEMKNFLSFPSSGLHPVSKVKVAYRLTPRLGRERSSYAAVAYEELWYHECRPIGCRKVHTLDIDSGQQGVIYFRPNRNMGNSHCAVANAIVRLMLDTGLKQAMVSTVYVPADIFDLVRSDLGQFNFFPYEIQPETGIRSTMHIFLQSQPSGRESSLFYFTN